MHRRPFWSPSEPVRARTPPSPQFGLLRAKFIGSTAHFAPVGTWHSGRQVASPVPIHQPSRDASDRRTKCCASRHEVLRTSREASEGVALHEERSAKYRELKAEGISHPPVRAGRFHDAQVAADASCHHALGSKCRVTRDEGVPPRFEGEIRTCRYMALGKAGYFSGVYVPDPE